MISVIIPVYHNEETLHKNLYYLEDQELIAERILVFDGYEVPSVYDDSYFYRDIKTISNYPDIPWGNARARNIGAINAVGDWLLFLDVDHTFMTKIDENEIQHLRKNAVNKFKRTYKGETTWPSGSVLIHKETFFKVGGYDERFCGNYGYEDLFLCDKIRNEYRTEIEIEFLLEGEVSMERDITINRELYERLKNEL